jgi:hypothetical protein
LSSTTRATVPDMAFPRRRQPKVVLQRRGRSRARSGGTWPSSLDRDDEQLRSHLAIGLPRSLREITHRYPAHARRDARRSSDPGAHCLMGFAAGLVTSGKSIRGCLRHVRDDQRSRTSHETRARRASRVVATGGFVRGALSMAAARDARDPPPRPRNTQTLGRASPSMRASQAPGCLAHPHLPRAVCLQTEPVRSAAGARAGTSPHSASGLARGRGVWEGDRRQAVVPVGDGRGRGRMWAPRANGLALTRGMRRGCGGLALRVAACSSACSSSRRDRVPARVAAGSAWDVLPRLAGTPRSRSGRRAWSLGSRC